MKTEQLTHEVAQVSHGLCTQEDITPLNVKQRNDWQTKNQILGYTIMQDFLKRKTKLNMEMKYTKISTVVVFRS